MKHLKKKQKQLKIKEKKQIATGANQNKRLEALTNKDAGHKDKEICNELVKERFDNITGKFISILF